MTAVTAHRVEPKPHATAAPAEANRSPDSDPEGLYTWVLSVTDWQVHALTVPCADALYVLATRCGAWHPVGCPVTVARRDEVCPRCAARGVAALELLDDRTVTGKGRAQ